MAQLIQPTTQFGISRGFGNGHNGIDYKFPLGTPVYAAAAGVVAFEGWGQNHSWITWMGGICVLLKHSDLYTGYSHLQSTVVNNGQHVAAGQLLGYSASTGNSTGPHLHFDALPLTPDFRNGYSARINPTPYFVTAPAAGGGNKDMTPNFIRRAYYMINNQNPSQAEVDFHMAKSNPESFINGFGDNPLWKQLENERNALAAQRDQANRERGAAYVERDELARTLGNANEQVKALESKITGYDTAIADLTAQIVEKDAKIKELSDAPAPVTAKPLDDYSLGELLVAAFSKTFKIK